MATLRSWGGSSLTTRAPMRMVPAVASSRPAIRRSTVDFPQPEGPTRTMSSPSSIASVKSDSARVPPGYTLSTCSSSTRAIARSVEEPLVGEEGERLLGDRVGREPSLDAVVLQVVRGRDERHRLVEGEVGAGDLTRARVDGVIEAEVAVDVIASRELAQVGRRLRRHGEGERRRVRRDGAAAVAKNTERPGPVLPVDVTARRHAGREAPHRVTELLDGEATLDVDMRGGVRAEASGRPARFVEHERRHQ